MIEIEPQFLKDLDEFAAAESLKEKLIEQYPELESSKEKMIKMIIEPRINESGVFSVDIVMIGYFKRPISVRSGAEFPFSKRVVSQGDKFFTAQIPSVNIRSFVTCIEVKHMDARKIFKNEAGHIIWKSGQKEKDISLQNKKQVDGLGTHIRKTLQKFPAIIFKGTNDERAIRDPYVSGFMFLVGLGKDNTLNDPAVIHSQSNGADIFRAIALHSLNGRNLSRWSNGKRLPLSSDAKENSNILIQAFRDDEAEYYLNAEFFSTPEPPTSIDFKRMNAIAKERISKDWIESVGNKLLIFQGLGGTGKTIRMLQLAYRKYSEQGANTLILTYNRALISNLQRLMAVMGISPHDDERGGIEIASLEKFMYDIYDEFKMLPGPENQKKWSDVHAELSQSFAEYLKSGVVNKDEIYESLRLDFDFCFVDEGQDWTIHEQTIIKEIFGENNIVVAHGKAQNIRSSELHWNRGHKDDEYRIVHTRKALRMKSNLSNFVKKFADVSLKNNEFTTLIKDDESIGGQIYLVIGNYFKDPSIHKGIINNQPDDIKTIDNLFCIYEKGIAEEYQKHFGNLWAGYDIDTRRVQPSKLDHARFIFYNSCRGLEGWTTFNFQFDKFWGSQINEGKKAFESDKNKGLLDDPETFANDFAAKWALIAFTRSIDSTVIHLESRNSLIADKLIDIQKNSPDTIELIEID